MLYLNDDIEHFDLVRALPLLSSQRLQQCMQYKHEQGRRENAAAYLLLCEGLRQEYGISEPPLFTFGDNGKPLLQDYPHIHFNLSHCCKAVVCVVDSRPVGVDIEVIGRYKESLARYTMNDCELASILASPEPAVAFARLWTMKEAVLKLSGTGIAVSSLKDVLTGSEAITTVVEKSKGYVYSICKQI